MAFLSGYSYRASIPFMPPSKWAAGHTYGAGDLCVPNTRNGYIYVCTTAGASGGSQPTFGTSLGGTTADNIAIWTCVSTDLYTISLTIDNTTASNTAGTIHCNGHCVDLTKDIRFTQGNGTTLYDFYRQSATGPWWVEVIAHPDYSGYVYYGKSSDTDASNGLNSFAFFDDFESGSLDQYDENTGWSIVTSGQYEGSDAAQGAAGTNILAKYQNIYQGLVRMAVKTSAVAARRSFPCRSYDSSSLQEYALCMYNGAYQFYDGTYKALPTATTYAANTYDIAEIAFDFANSLFRWWINGVSKGTSTLKDGAGTTLTLASRHLTRVPRSITTDTNETLTIDQVWIRNYVYPEPAWSTPGSEEAGTVSYEISAIVSSTSNITDNVKQFREVSSPILSISGINATARQMRELNARIASLSQIVANNEQITEISNHITSISQISATIERTQEKNASLSSISSIIARSEIAGQTTFETSARITSISQINANINSENPIFYFYDSAEVICGGYLDRSYTAVSKVYFFATDAVLQKLVYTAFRMDLIIDASRMPSFNAKPKTWSLSYVDPDERIAF